MSNEGFQWLVTNGELLAKLVGAMATIVGGVYGFIKLIKYLSNARRRTDEKLDAIKQTVTDHHNTDFQEVKGTLNEFKTSIDVLASKVNDIKERSGRVELQVETINNNVLGLKGDISATVATVDGHEYRLSHLEGYPAKTKSKSTKKKSTKRRVNTR